MGTGAGYAGCGGYGTRKDTKGRISRRVLGQTPPSCYRSPDCILAAAYCSLPRPVTNRGAMGVLHPGAAAAPWCCSCSAAAFQLSHSCCSHRSHLGAAAHLLQVTGLVPPRGRLVPGRGGLVSPHGGLWAAPVLPAATTFVQQHSCGTRWCFAVAAAEQRNLSCLHASWCCCTWAAALCSPTLPGYQSRGYGGAVPRCYSCYLKC